MINLLSQNTDSIPFVLRKEVIAIVDTIPANDFLSYQYLPLDSSKLFYDIDAINQEVVFFGLEALVRPFMQQFGSVLFLVFTLLFVLSALVFINSRQVLFNNFANIFTIGSNKKKIYSEQITLSDVWSNLFGIFLALLIYSILFFDLALQYSNLFYNGHDYLILFLQIFVGISLFASIKYLFYRLMGAMFSKSKTNILTNVYLRALNLMGTLSFIPIVAYFYIPEARMYVLFFLIAVFIMGRIAVFTKSYTFFIKAHIGILYFFVYLCALEIMPYFLLYKAIVLIR